MARDPFSRLAVLVVDLLTRRARRRRDGDGEGIEGEGIDGEGFEGEGSASGSYEGRSREREAYEREAYGRDGRDGRDSRDVRGREGREREAYAGEVGGRRVRGRRSRERADPGRGIPEGMNHVEETLAAARARARYEERAGEEFDALVARESGTFGWETFSLFLLLAGSACCAVLGAAAGLTRLALALGGFGLLCLVLLLLRAWYAVRRRPGRRERPFM